jgi:tetratricopeptide (TPR) repeat protein
MNKGSHHNIYLSQLGLADLEAYCGQIDQAIARIEDLRESLKGSQSLVTVNLAELLAYKGNTDEAVAMLDSIQSEEPSILFQVTRLYIDLGMAEKANTNIKRLKNRIEQDVKAQALLLEGLLLIHQENYSDAMSAIEESRKLVDSCYSRYVAGICYLQMSAYIEAYGELEACLKRKGEMACMFLDEIPTLRFLTPVYYYRGRAQDGLGSKAAVKSYQQFLDLWGSEDAAAIAIVKDARARIA